MDKPQIVTDTVEDAKETANKLDPQTVKTVVATAVVTGVVMLLMRRKPAVPKSVTLVEAETVQVTKDDVNTV